MIAESLGADAQLVALDLLRNGGEAVARARAGVLAGLIQRVRLVIRAAPGHLHLHLNLL